MRVKRRSFLKSAGVATAGVASLAGAAAPQDKPRGLLITSGENSLAETLADSLASEYEVRVTSRTAIESRHAFVQSDLGHEESTDDLVRGIGRIVHLAEPLPGEDTPAKIDYATRCTYNLLRAAAGAGVERAVFLSTLELMTPYDEDFLVTEAWRPRPGLDGASLPKHLGEYVCREFARSNAIDVVVLRLGKVVSAAERSGRPFDPLWVASEDIIQAVRLALEPPRGERGRALGRWSVFHISSGSSEARFRSETAARRLGYEPKFPG